MPTSMSIGDFLFMCVAFYGAVFLIKDSTILAIPRAWITKIGFFEKLLNCSFCTGTWVGAVYGAWESSKQGLNVCQCAESIVYYALASATVSYILDLITRIMEKRLEDE